MKFFVLGSILFLTACTTPTKNPIIITPIPLPVSTQEGSGVGTSNSASLDKKSTTNITVTTNESAPQKPRALNPEPRTNIYVPIAPLSGSGNEAFAAMVLVGAVVGAAQVFTDSKPRTDLSGSCVYGSPEEAAFTSACRNVQVHLLKNEKDIVASTSTNENGDFRFFIPASESYFVQVVDRKGRSARTPQKVGRANFISLFLKP